MSQDTTLDPPTLGEKLGCLAFIGITGFVLWGWYADTQKHHAEQARQEQVRAIEQAHRAAFAAKLAIPNQPCEDYYALMLEMFHLPNPSGHGWPRSVERLAPAQVEQTVAVIKGDGSTLWEVHDSNNRPVGAIWNRDWTDQNTPKRWEGIWRTTYTFITPNACAGSAGIGGSPNGTHYLVFAYTDPGGGRQPLAAPNL